MGDLSNMGLLDLLVKVHKVNIDEANDLCDFLLPMLAIENKKRPTAF